MRTSGLLIIILSLAIWSCKTPSVSSSATSYSEDLSALRPSLAEAELEKEWPEESIRPTAGSATRPSGDIKNELEQVNTIIVDQNKEKNYVDGYTIQVYTGSDRDAAMEAKNKVYGVNSDLKPSMQYHQPNYKVKVGQYIDKLEAHEIIESLKKEFPHALLIPERIYVSYE